MTLLAGLIIAVTVPHSTEKRYSARCEYRNSVANQPDLIELSVKFQ
jgi:hypothetical protein